MPLVIFCDLALAALAIWTLEQAAKKQRTSAMLSLASLRTLPLQVFPGSFAARFLA